MNSVTVKRLTAFKLCIVVVFGALKVASWVDGPTGGDVAAALVHTNQPILTASVELPVARVGSQDGNSDAPQFFFGQVGLAYEASYRHLRGVDFANLTYRVSSIAPGLSIPLENGAYDARNGVGFERAELRNVKTCDNPSMTPAATVVRLRYMSGAGSSNCDEIVQVFGLPEGRLVARHEIVYACAQGGTYVVDCHRGTITATGDRLAWRRSALLPVGARYRRLLVHGGGAAVALMDTCLDPRLDTAPRSNNSRVGVNPSSLGDGLCWARAPQQAQV